MNSTDPSRREQELATAKLMRDACIADLISFSKFIKEDYDVQAFHEQIADALMKIESGEIKRLAIEMPPRS